MSTHLQLDDMPGPSDEAKALQYQQSMATDAMYEAWKSANKRHGRDNDEAVRSDPEFVASKTAYEATVTALLALLGTDAPCAAVDADLWSVFSDCYKDDKGFRPGLHRSRKEVQAYLDRRRERYANKAEY